MNRKFFSVEALSIFNHLSTSVNDQLKSQLTNYFWTKAKETQNIDFIDTMKLFLPSNKNLRQSIQSEFFDQFMPYSTNAFFISLLNKIYLPRDPQNDLN